LDVNFIRNKKAFWSLSLILMLAMTIIIAFAQPSYAQVGVPQPEKTKVTSPSHQHLLESAKIQQ
jgi:hypothetical protein